MPRKPATELFAKYGRVEAGMGVTLNYPGDKYGYVVVAVSESGLTADIEALDTPSLDTGHEPAYYRGPFPVWDHIYTEDELRSMRAPGPRLTMRLTNKGWSVQGGYAFYSIGRARYRRDWSD